MQKQNRTVLTDKDLKLKKDLPVQEIVSLTILLSYLFCMLIYYQFVYLQHYPTVTVFIYLCYIGIGAFIIIITVLEMQTKIDAHNICITNLGNIYINMGIWNSLPRSTPNEIYRH